MTGAWNIGTIVHYWIPDEGMPRAAVIVGGGDETKRDLFVFPTRGSSGFTALGIPHIASVAVLDAPRIAHWSWRPKVTP